MKQTLIATKSMRYGTRRLVAGDTFEASNRDARVLMAIGKAKEPTEKPQKMPSHDELGFLRAEYKKVVGKNAFHGWKPSQLREKIAAAKG